MVKSSCKKGGVSGYGHYSLKDIEAKQLFIKNHISSNETIEITEWKQFSLFT
jgi:hypothetical protein